MQTLESLVTQLIQWCEINSGSNHLTGLAKMHQLLSDSFSPLCDEIQSLDFPPIQFLELDGQYTAHRVGKGLLCRKRPHLKRRVLLCGHMDTVFSAQSDFQKTTWLSDDKLQGPGVADMKGGLLIMLAALQAFEKTDVSQTLGWDVFINTDEELGSLASRQMLVEIGQHAQAALVFEPALDETGTLARKRKGNGHFLLSARGKTAHAGRDFYLGRNAITFLAKALLKINALNGQKPGVTFNIALIQGGTVLNQVPEHASAKLEIRYAEEEEADWALTQIHRICDEFNTPEEKLTLQGEFHRPCKSVTLPTQYLFERTQRLAQNLGLNLTWQDTGGCCDGNNLAQRGLAVLDSLGPRGGHIHTQNEYICVASLTERIKLITSLLHDLAQGGLEELYSTL